MSIDLNLRITGNPYVDSGIFAIKTKLEKKSIDEIVIPDLKDLASQVSKLYVKDGWKKNMHSIFPNSILVNPAFAKKGNIDEIYFDYLDTLIEHISPISDEGNCVACGRRNSIQQFQKSAVPLTGSGSLKNYFSFASDGVDYCPLCALLIQFSPLVMYRSGGKLMLLHSNSEKVMQYWAKKAIKDILKQKTTDNYTGCFNEGFTNPTNAIFQMINNIIISYDERNWADENSSLNFYYFTNYNQGPELDIFNVPTKVFRFLVGIPSDERFNWNLIVKNAYKYVKKDEIDSFDEYKNNPNEVYNRLLRNASILRFFFYPRIKKAFCSWELLRYYMNEVRNMDDERLNAIKNLGDNISDYIKESDDKRTLSKLENASSYTDFRNTLRKIIKKRISNNDEKPLFTFDDYVNNLVPDYRFYRETQDLLLFRIYENLHDWMIENDYVKEEEMEEK